MKSTIISKPTLQRFSTLFLSVTLAFLTTTLHAEQKDGNSSPCEVTPETTDQWYDLSHAYLSKKFCTPGAAFDSFFGDDRNLEDEKSGSYVRWRNDIVWNESDRLAFHTELRAKLKLPKINKRLKLFITSEHDDSFDNPLGSTTDANAITNQDAIAQKEPRQVSDSTVGLQYDISNQPSYNTSFRIGIRTQIPLQLHTNIRYRYTLPFGNKNLFRFTETIYWRKWEGYGETSRFDLERLVNTKTLARTSLSATFSEVSEGVDLSSNIGTFHKLSKHAGISFDIVSAASTRPNTVIKSYGFITKYRRNFYRDWLFFELIPEINWIRDDDGKYEGINTLTFRLDVQFWRD